MADNLTILIVDDDVTNRLILRALVKELGYLTVEAEDGQKAIEMVLTHDIDIVLMDVMMPVMDGYDAARIIKMESSGFIPIIFLTAMTDEKSLAKCIEVGGDDFLTKPYNHVLLKSKIESMVRIKALYEKVSVQNDALSEHKARVNQEMILAKNVFSNLINHNMKGKQTGLNFSMSSMSVFNGDVILAERNKADGLNVLIGDFTGHGLTAALGSIPVSDMFYTMTQKGFSYAEVLSSINNKLVRLLPTSMFMAAVFISVDRHNNVATIINSGLPEIYLVRNNKIIKTFSSSSFAMGIEKNSPDDISSEMVSLEYGDRIFVATDGIMEAENREGELYGKQRILDSINENSRPEFLFDKILFDCLDFCGQAEQSDDVTLLELCHLEEVSYDEENTNGISTSKSSNWSMQFSLDAESLRKFDLLPYIMQGVNGLQSISHGHSALTTVLTEVYANALDHGLLDLDSSMKSTAEGYMEFYQEKSSRLQNIKEGDIRIELSHEATKSGGGRLTIHVMDSGPGFDYEKIKNIPLNENKGYSGRGLSLINHLCKEVKILGKGNAIMAVYEWD